MKTHCTTKWSDYGGMQYGSPGTGSEHYKRSSPASAYESGSKMRSSRMYDGEKAGPVYSEETLVLRASRYGVDGVKG